MKCYELLCKPFQGVLAVEDLSLEVPWAEWGRLIEVSKACTSAGILAHGSLIATVDIKSPKAEHPDIEGVFLSYPHAAEDAA
ncbi:hypothetical protein RJ40_07825 [Methanofollis aquaemaris]|uniref:Uncharacterized protein n=1 Tax=Methanofollis aquaemaris TaxID=126734 RepID=A0A8A3S5K4_9EURY|nr:hypothetical protein [Methanofollis aquaemaris]QSZ67418.1 hypothetical protein RJ40_07825 [Methanofollis aquaemaris]